MENIDLNGDTDDLVRLSFFVGIGKAINGGFGLVLDGSAQVDQIIRAAITWDVMGGVARRSWARNANAMTVSAEFNAQNQDRGHITLPFVADTERLTELVTSTLEKRK